MFQLLRTQAVAIPCLTTDVSVLDELLEFLCQSKIKEKCKYRKF